MALVGRRDGRNFGYGRQLSYAGPQALRDLFGGGHYGTVKAHSDRWAAFVRWCRSEEGPGFNDARQINWQTLLDYSGHLLQQVEQGELAIATAQNRLSSVNRTMAALRGDQYVKVPSPSKALGNAAHQCSLFSAARPRPHTGEADRRGALRKPAAARRGHRSVSASHRYALARGDFGRPSPSKT